MQHPLVSLSQLRGSFENFTTENVVEFVKFLIDNGKKATILSGLFRQLYEEGTSNPASFFIEALEYSTKISKKNERNDQNINDNISTLLPDSVLSYIGSYLSSKEVFRKLGHLNRKFLEISYKASTLTNWDFAMVASQNFYEHPCKFKLKSQATKIESLNLNEDFRFLFDSRFDCFKSLKQIAIFIIHDSSVNNTHNDQSTTNTNNDSSGSNNYNNNNNDNSRSSNETVNNDHSNSNSNNNSNNNNNNPHTNSDHHNTNGNNNNNNYGHGGMAYERYAGVQQWGASPPQPPPGVQVYEDYSGVYYFGPFGNRIYIFRKNNGYFGFNNQNGNNCHYCNNFNSYNNPPPLMSGAPTGGNSSGAWGGGGSAIRSGGSSWGCGTSNYNMSNNHNGYDSGFNGSTNGSGSGMNSKSDCNWNYYSSDCNWDYYSSPGVDDKPSF